MELRPLQRNADSIGNVLAHTWIGIKDECQSSSGLSGSGSLLAVFIIVTVSVAFTVRPFICGLWSHLLRDADMVWKVIGFLKPLILDISRVRGPIHFALVACIKVGAM